MGGLTHWSEKKKLETVQTWLALGKVPMVSAVVGVPEDTIRSWKMQPWWKEYVSQVQTESNQELDQRISGIIDRSLDTVVDRLDHGEYILDSKTGTVKRVPVKIKDAHKVAVDLIDKRDVIRGRPAQEKQEQQTSDILKKLAGQFSEWVQLNMKQPRIVEGEVVAHAIHEERQEGLQDGVQQVPQQAEAEGQQGG